MAERKKWARLTPEQEEFLAAQVAASAKQGDAADAYLAKWPADLPDVSVGGVRNDALMAERERIIWAYSKRRRKAQETGAVPRTRPQISDGVPPGAVISQEIAPGDAVTQTTVEAPPESELVQALRDLVQESDAPAEPTSATLPDAALERIADNLEIDAPPSTKLRGYAHELGNLVSSLRMVIGQDAGQDAGDRRILKIADRLQSLRDEIADGVTDVWASADDVWEQAAKILGQKLGWRHDFAGGPDKRHIFEQMCDAVASQGRVLFVPHGDLPMREQYLRHLATGGARCETAHEADLLDGPPRLTEAAPPSNPSLMTFLRERHGLRQKVYELTGEIARLNDELRRCEQVGIASVAPVAEALRATADAVNALAAQQSDAVAQRDVTIRTQADFIAHLQRMAGVA